MLEAAFFIDGIADVEETVMRVEVHEDTDASGSVAPQRDDYYGAVAIEISAFVERFVGMRIEFQSGRIDGRKFLRMRGIDEAFGLHGAVGGVLKLFVA